MRYRVEFDYDRFKKEGVGVSYVKDGDIIIYTTDPLTPKENEQRYDLSGRVSKLATQWLNEHFPDWKNPGAYWD